MKQAPSPISHRTPRPGSADWLLEHEYVEHRDEVIRSVRKQLFGRGISLDPADLDAAYNSAWHALHQKLTSGEQVANRQGLLVVIMVRRVLSDRRTLAGSTPSVPLDALDEPVLADRGPEPSQQVSDREQVRQLLEGLRERLSGRELQAATLCYLHGHTRPDAARLLDIPPKRMEKLMDRVSREISGVVRDVESGWCTSNRSLITAYALGVLASSGPRHALAQDHLAHCAPCRRQVLVLRGMAALSPPVPLLGGGGGAAVVAGAVGGGAAVTLGVGAPVGAGIGGALSGAAALIGTAIVLGGGVAGSSAPPVGEPTAARALAPDPSPRTTSANGLSTALAVAPGGGSPSLGLPSLLPRHGAPANGDAPAHGPAAGGPPGPVTSVPPALRVPGASLPGTQPVGAQREERSSSSDGATATGSASGTSTAVTTDAGVDDDGRRYGAAEATASGPSAEASAGAAAELPGSAVDSQARAGGESDSSVDVGARVRAEVGGADPSHAGGSADAWAIGGTDHAELSTAATTTARGDVPADAAATSAVSGTSAASTSSSAVSGDQVERTASGTATASSAGTDPARLSYEIPVPKDLAASFRWSASMAFLDPVTQQQVQLDLGWLLADLPAPGITLTMAMVGGTGLDSQSIALAYGAGATTTATVTLSGGQAGAIAGTGDGRGWSVALAVVDGTSALATGGARGEGDGRGSREALVDASATTSGWASVISALLADDPSSPAESGRQSVESGRQSVEVAALAQIARLLAPMLPPALVEHHDALASPAADPDPSADHGDRPSGRPKRTDGAPAPSAESAPSPEPSPPSPVAATDDATDPVPAPADDAPADPPASPTPAPAPADDPAERDAPAPAPASPTTAAPASPAGAAAPEQPVATADDASDTATVPAGADVGSGQ